MIKDSNIVRVSQSIAYPKGEYVFNNSKEIYFSIEYGTRIVKLIEAKVSR